MPDSRNFSSQEERPAETLGVRLLEIDEASEGQRLDNFLLCELKGVPKSHVYRIIRSGEVRVNGGRAQADTRLQLGDLLRLPPVRQAKRAPKPEAAIPTEELPVLFEDDALLVINKPAGLAVHGGSGLAFGVIEQLRRARPQARFLELVHRLDRDTSGILMIAKRRSALVKLHEMIRQGMPDKRYLALSLGTWNNKSVKLEAPLAKVTLANGERRVKIQSDGQYAKTVFRVRQTGVLPDGRAVTLVEAELVTGRTHQIRVHLAHLGHPILGDDKYGDALLNAQLTKWGLKRMFLHASPLSLAHPLTGEPLTLAAPLPDELLRFWSACKPQNI